MLRRRVAYARLFAHRALALGHGQHAVIPEVAEYTGTITGLSPEVWMAWSTMRPAFDACMAGCDGKRTRLLLEAVRVGGLTASVSSIPVDATVRHPVSLRELAERRGDVPI